MTKIRYGGLGCVALLLVTVLAACSSEPAAIEPFPGGTHVFEGRVSESGGNFVLMVGDESYTLEGNMDEIRKFAGQNVQVAATMGENRLRVTRITPVTPLEAPDQS
jgi:hypothetical protein